MTYQIVRSSPRMPTDGVGRGILVDGVLYPLNVDLIGAKA